jgi:hypothetical protein
MDLELCLPVTNFESTGGSLQERAFIQCKVRGVLNRSGGIGPHGSGFRRLRLVHSAIPTFRKKTIDEQYAQVRVRVLHSRT